MPAEESNQELSFPNSHLMDSFDEVAKGLAAGTISRRRAIKLSSAALLGSMGLLSLFPAVAGAQGLCEGKPAISNRKCPGLESHCGVCETCQCARTVSGRKRCLNLEVTGGCPDRDQCDTNSDCSGNEVCVQIGGCCGRPRRNLCAPPCPTNPDHCPPRM